MTTDQSIAVLSAPRTTPPTPAEGTSHERSRSLAPDLARGMMLLLIASANVWGYLYGRATGPGYRPVDGTGLDRVVDGLVSFLVDDRSRPMFAILYGFGIATMAARMLARGEAGRRVRVVLARRSGWLVVLGMLHAGLLFGGDILGPYGATGLVALLLVDRRAAVLMRWLWVALLIMIAGRALMLFGVLDIGGGGEIEMPTASYLASVPERLLDGAVNTVSAGLALFFVPQVVLGILLARAGWLTRPQAHRRRLGQVAVAGGVVNLVLNLPFALTVARVWSPDEPVQHVLTMLHELSGIAVGLGWVCLFGWLAAVLADRRGKVVGAVAAVGERSLTSYLLQSLLMAPLLSAWGLGWGATIGTAQAALLAVAVWLVTVAIAVALAASGRRGPFEVALRRLSYGRR